MTYQLSYSRTGIPQAATMTAAQFHHDFPSEGTSIEFKQGLSEHEIREAAAAFSNSEGGVVLLGVGDDGTIHGLKKINGETRAHVHQYLAPIRDCGRYELYHLTITSDTDSAEDPREILLIAISPRREGFAQLPDGRVLVRRDARNQALYGDDLVRFIGSHAMTRFELTPTERTVEQADPELLTELAHAFGWQDPDLYQQRLAENSFLDTSHTPALLTVTGLLTLTRNPEKQLGKTWIEIFRYRDNSDSYDKRFSITGPVHHQISEAAQAISDEIGTDMVVIGMRRYELERVPLRVLREALANAVAHRTYENTRQAIRVDIRPTTVTITSPGSLPDPVTLENMREQNAARNPILITALRRFHLAEDAGLGVDVMQDVMEEKLLDPPEFHADDTSVTTVLPVISDIGAHERAWLIDSEQYVDSSGIRPRDRLLVIQAVRGNLLTNASARRALGVDARQAREALERLCEAGYLQRSGTRGGASYSLARVFNLPMGENLSADEKRELLLALAAEAPLTNRIARQATKLDRLAVVGLLNAMVEEGLLVREGERRGTRYVLP